MSQLLCAEGDVSSMGPLGPDLLWRLVVRPSFGPSRPALFLDRDGVIIEERHYLCDPRQVKLLPEIDGLIRTAHSNGFAVVVVTNQAGIGRGIFGWSEFAAVERRMAELLASRGAMVDALYACPFHPQGLRPYAIKSHPWRKPNPGMLLEAARSLNLDLTNSLLVGDKASDILAARRAMLPRAVHVLTGHGVQEARTARGLATKTFEVIIAEGPHCVPVHL